MIFGDKNAVFGMLSSLTPENLLLLLDSVTIEDGGKYHSGCLILLRQRLDQEKERTKASLSADGSYSTLAVFFSEDGEQSGDAHFSKRLDDDECFLLWVPYSFLRARLSDTKLAVLFGTDSPSSFSSFFLEDAVSFTEKEPCEWHKLFSVPVKKIAKVQRKVEKGKVPVIMFYFLDGTVGQPLIFKKGGLSKFLDVLRKISPLKQSSFFSDDFIVYGEDNNKVMENFSASSKSLMNSKNYCVGGKNADCVTADLPHDSGGLSKRDAKTIFRPDKMQSVVYKRRNSPIDAANLLAAAATRVQAAFSWFKQKTESSDEDKNSERKFGSSAMMSIVSEGLCEHSAGTIALFRFKIPAILPLDRGRKMGSCLTADEWRKCFSVADGRIDPCLFEQARKRAYAGGVERSIRFEVWCFMLNLYQNVEDSTESERQAVRSGYKKKYAKLTAQWNDVFLKHKNGENEENEENEEESKDNFFLFSQLFSTIEKDVLRTDRSYEKYISDDSPQLRMLQNVLMSYAVFNPDLGYCQGMSDILSPIVLLSETEEEAFMCFSIFLAERCKGVFQLDVVEGIRPKLKALKTIVAHFIPDLYNYLRHRHCDDMAFCFRWLLLFFKREFSLDDVMLLWDVVLSCPYTPQFEIFIAAALLKLFAPQIVSNKLSQDALITSINHLPKKLDVRNVILLAQEFYEHVAARVVEINCAEIIAGVTKYPTLNDILRTFE